MIIWMVYQHDYEGSFVTAIKSTKELAVTFATANEKKEWSVEAYEVDVGERLDLGSVYGQGGVIQGEGEEGCSS